MIGGMHRPRIMIALVAVAGAGVALLSNPADASTPPVAPHWIAPLSSTEEPAGAVQVNATGAATLVDPNTQCGGPSADPVPDGQDIVVTIGTGPSFTVGKIPATWWETPPTGDAAWRLQFRGFMWVHALAQRAYQDGQLKSLDALVAQVLAFHAQDPDPGTSTATTTAHANAWGWDEGTALRRLGAENCLYSLTKDARMAAVAAKDVQVQFGPRYYRPPSHIVHNHGVMADLAVVRAADLLGRRDWSDRSIARLLTNARGAWTAAGTSIEQSSSYHVFNVALWGEVVEMMTAHGVAASSVQTVRDLDARAGRISPWLTEPDGRLVVLGDSTADRGFTRSLWTARTLRDDQAGLVVGRWSWVQPAATYYTVRYGPRRIAHGQQERAGITWSTRNRRVLVSPGKGVYDRAGNYRAWVIAPQSHNVAIADRRTLDARASVTRTGSIIRTTWHNWTTVDRLYGIRHVRQYNIVGTTGTLVVKDTYDGRARFHQYWHLDPSWVFVSRSADGKHLRFRSGTRTLTVTTTGTASVRRGVTRPVAGWNFPDGSTRLAANELQVAAAGTAQTTFVVR